MNQVIKVKTISLESFSKENANHLALVKKINQDEAFNKYFPEWKEITHFAIDDDTNTYYSYVIKDENKYIGIATLVFNSDEVAIFSQGFLNEARGHGYAYKVRQIIIDYLTSLGVKKMIGYVKKDNISSLKSLLKAGAILKEADDDYYEVCQNLAQEKNKRK